ncbi:MAG: amidohydrolase family protein [Pirellulaceae bacterium]|nr:amidohydrolase family protein [Pirellulaceae bacterium]
MQKTLSIRADWLWTGEGQPQANGCITLHGDRVTSISTHPPTSAIDIGAYCILPGLINSHAHLEFSDLQKPVAAGTSFADWILRVVQHRQIAAPTAQNSDVSAERKGLIESHANGVRLVLDIVHGNVRQPTSKPADFDASVSESSDSEGYPSTIRFAELMSTTSLRAKQTWRNALQIRKHYPFGLSPHAPYTTTEGLVRRAVNKCIAWNIPIMMHLAESQDEMRWIATGDGPLQALLEMVAGPDLLSTSHRLSLADYTRQLCRAPLAFIVHGNYLDEPSLAILESNRDHAAVVYCPRTHAHFGHSTHPLLAMRSRGIPVLLGTDSRASNPDLSILGEARHVRRNFSGLEASEIFSMMTTKPSKMLGCEFDTGFIRIGCRNRFTAIACTSLRAEQVLEDLLECEYQAKAIEDLLRLSNPKVE